ncbi:MAG: hypothetical protein U5L10_03275 [Candidatus Moranbacteria bacterium]|nr:hypothetical protein [Candidatus Moranbacteria bacterium]
MSKKSGFGLVTRVNRLYNDMLMMRHNLEKCSEEELEEIEIQITKLEELVRPSLYSPRGGKTKK